MLGWVPPDYYWLALVNALIQTIRHSTMIILCKSCWEERTLECEWNFKSIEFKIRKLLSIEYWWSTGGLQPYNWSYTVGETSPQKKNVRLTRIISGGCGSSSTSWTWTCAWPWLGVMSACCWVSWRSYRRTGTPALPLVGTKDIHERD